MLSYSTNVFILLLFNALRMEVYFCHQNQNAKNIGNFTPLLKPHNIWYRYSFERYWDKLSGGAIIFEILPPLGKLHVYHFLKFSSKYLQSLKG
jgi:hypothetical protein